MATYVIQSPHTLDYLTPDGTYTSELEWAQTYASTEDAEWDLNDTDQVVQVLYAVMDGGWDYVSTFDADGYTADSERDAAIWFETRAGAYAFITVLESPMYTDDGTYNGPFTVEEFTV